MGDNDNQNMEPQSIKDMLHFLGKLEENQTLRNKFFDQLETNTEKLIDTNSVEGMSYKYHLRDLLTNVKALRKALLKYPNDFGKYNDMTEDGMMEAFEVLVQWLPMLHSEFMLLYQLASSEGQGLGGNQWIEEYFGPGHTDTHVHKWLTDNIGEVIDKFSVKKGFTEEDLKTEGRLTAPVTGNLGINYYAGGPLNYAQYGVFLHSGDVLLPSNLASAMLFVAEFCRQINADYFPENLMYGKATCIKTVCKDLVHKIDGLHKLILPLYNPLTVREVEAGEKDKPERKAEGSFNGMYKGKLKKHNVDDYITWMRGNITKLILLLKKMHLESSRWNAEEFVNVQSHGPSKYGYTFIDNKWDASLYFTFKQPIDEVSSITANATLFGILQCVDAPRAVRERMRIEEIEKERKEKTKSVEEELLVARKAALTTSQQLLAEKEAAADEANKATQGLKGDGKGGDVAGKAKAGDADKNSFSAYSLRVVTALLALLSVM